MSARPILAGFEDGASVLIARTDGDVSAAAALVAAERLAALLPPSRYVVNLCDSLDGFIVTLVAALVGRRTVISPPSRLPSVIAELGARFADAVCVADARADVPAPVIGVIPLIDDAIHASSKRVSTWPLVDDAHVAAILFTSGSTGVPTAHRKTWGALADGARALMRSIARPSARVAIVGTVPPQHMFGLETTVMLPLQSGMPACAVRPALPADLADAAALASRVAVDGAWLMTTPLQLRAFHRDSPAIHGVAGVVASTMPLDPMLAATVEREWGVPVHEIYGCTEGGVLGVRRASTESAWTPANGLTFAIADDGRASVSGGHVGERLELADRLRAAGTNGAFELIGRDGDVVKVAGKRASLAGLTHELLAIAGVRDGAFFVERDDAPRVAAAAIAPGWTAVALRQALARRLDPAFLPRPLLIVDAMPRTASGKLPLAALRTLAEKERARSDGRTDDRALSGRAKFDAGHPALAGHFPGHPIVPGVLLLEAVQQVLRDAGLDVVECVHAKLLTPLAPGREIEIRIGVDAGGSARFEISAGSTPVASGRLRCVEAETRR